MKQIARAIFSPLLIGALVGTTIPLARYVTLCQDAEASHPLKVVALESLTKNVIVGCMVGLAFGVLADLAIQLIRKRATRS